MAHTVLVPPLSRLNLSTATPLAKNLRIPFFGVYWFFKLPHRRPPPGSYETRGSLTALTFRAGDHARLSMEARQNFGTRIATRCCSRIEVDVMNADSYAGTVSLELLLADTARNPAQQMSLGAAAVRSTPPWRPGTTGQTIAETLRFVMPADPPLEAFDEAILRFHRHKLRDDHSARISIEAFGLIPR